VSLLLISLAALALGPVLFRAAGSARSTLATLDGFVVVAIVGLVVIHIIPHAIAAAGLGAVGFALIGLAGPGLIEKWLHRAARYTHTATVVLAILGLTVHAFFDGVALAGPSDHGDGTDMLAIAVVLHRLPVAITIWWLLRPNRGIGLALGALVALGAATILGFSTGDAIAGMLEERWLGLFQSLVAGSVLHVVFHRPHPGVAPPATGPSRVYAGAGALIGLAMVVALSETHLPLQTVAAGLDVGETFLALTLESAPALLLAFAMAGIVQALLPRATFGWMRTGSATSESMRGMLFGLPLPICSCGVIPIYRSLIDNGVPAAAGMAFLVATPELGLDAVLISLPLLGGELAVARVIAAALVAFLVGRLVGALARNEQPVKVIAPTDVARGSLISRFKDGLRFGFGEIVDHTGPWILLGLAVASIVEPMLHGDWLTALPLGVDVILFALLGMPSYVCASGATPFVAVLIHKGVSPGAALAFLLTGPATNVTTFGILSQLHGRRIALLFGGVVAAGSIGLGFAVNALLPEVSGIALHEAAGEEPSYFAISCAVALGLIYLASVLRQGPRGYIGQILTPYRGSADCDDDCHDSC
jgi:uncharacterized membrane protein YraQ (UPF0718 family)